MAVAAGCYAFSPDGEYFIHCGNDGKLKIWDTPTGRLKQEYTSNYHLSSPCSVLTWIYVSTQTTSASPSPWKKRRKKSFTEEPSRRGIVAMGSANGRVTLYDTTSSVTTQLDGHTGAVTAVTWSENAGLFTAADDHHIIHWNLQENGVKCKWKSGKSKATSLAVSGDGKSLVSGERVVKWWDLATKQLIRTFTGHANQVTCLCTVKMPFGNNYAISGACSDGCLNVWMLDEHKNDRTPVVTLALQDDPVSVSVNVSEDSQVTVLAVTRSGQAHLFKYQPNGRTKPLKPTLNVAVASDVSEKDTVQQISIVAAKLTEDQKLLLAYGSFLSPMFENVTPDFSDRVQCLVRSESRRNKERKEEVSKVKATIVEGDVEYLAPGINSGTQKRNRSSSGSQLLLKERLENLSLSAESSSTGRLTSKGSNMAQLLMQGLNSKDRTILSNVLFIKNDSVIRNTIAKLPVQAIGPLLKELTVLLQGKTYASRIAVRWLELLLTTHTGHFLSLSDLTDTFGPILSLIDAKLGLLTELSRLKGRVSLVTGQISQATEEHDKETTEDCVLVYQDPDSSDEGAGVEDEDLESESDENWEEISNQDGEDDQEDQDEQNEQEIRSTKSSDDNDSICS